MSLADTPVTAALLQPHGELFLRRRLGDAGAPQLRPQVPDRGDVRFRLLAFGGEVVAYEYGVGGIEAEGLEPAQVDLAAARDADLGLRVDEPEEAEDLEALLRGEPAAALEGRARD